MVRRAGFTLIELLVVIAIILVLAIAVVPNIGAGISGTQLSTASRSLLQAVRYARTMAILHQVETELVLVSAAEGARIGVTRDGKPDPNGARIEVRIAEETMRQARTAEITQDGGVSDAGGGDEGGAFATSNDDNWGTESDAGDAETGGIGVGTASTGAALGDLASEIHSVFPCGTVAFEFLRFTDEDEEEDPEDEILRRDQDAATGKAQSARNDDRFGLDDEGGDEEDSAARTISFLFDSDGTCRPFDLLLKDSADGDDPDTLAISIDRWGRGKIEGRDDD